GEKNRARRSFDLISGVNACSIKGDVKEHFSPCGGGAEIFRDMQRLSPLQTLVWCRALWGWVCVVPYQQVDLLGCDNAERFLKLGKRCGYMISYGKVTGVRLVKIRHFLNLIARRDRVKKGGLSLSMTRQLKSLPRHPNSAPSSVTTRLS